MISLKKISFGVSGHEKLIKLCSLFYFFRGVSNLQKELFHLLVKLLAGNLEFVESKFLENIFKNFYYGNLNFFFKLSGHFPFGQLSPRTIVSNYPKTITPVLLSLRQLSLNNYP